MSNRMKRLAGLLPVTLVVVAPLAQAGWVPVTTRAGGAQAERFRTYIDPTTVARRGENVTVRVLVNYRERSEEGMASAVGVNEFDCLNDRMRSRTVSGYGEPDGKGRLIREFKNIGAWNNVQPGTTNEALLQSACDFYPQWWSE